MKASEIMKSNPACCTPNAKLSEVAQLMISNDCGEIPIVESEQNKKLVGVVTDRDIVVRGVAQDKSPSQTEISNVMTGNVVSVQESADLQECCQKMEDYQIRRIPVVDSEGSITGIIAQADIALKTGSRETAEVVRDISQPTH